MLSVPDSVATKLPHLPEGPGVYLWKGRDGTTLYVGKAKRLRSRVRSYFANDQLESVKTRHLVGLIADLETIVVPSEAHALILEANLIKEYHPRFNIALSGSIAMSSRRTEAPARPRLPVRSWRWCLRCSTFGKKICWGRCPWWIMWPPPAWGL